MFCGNDPGRSPRCFLLFLVALVFMWFWNTTMPQVFRLSEITFWVAFRLLLIAGFLTSGGFANFNWNAQ